MGKKFIVSHRAAVAAKGRRVADPYKMNSRKLLQKPQADIISTSQPMGGNLQCRGCRGDIDYISPQQRRNAAVDSLCYARKRLCRRARCRERFTAHRAVRHRRVLGNYADELNAYSVNNVVDV